MRVYLLPLLWLYALPVLALPSIPKVWVGETMEPDQGGMTLHSVLFDMESGSRDGSFSFILKGRKTGVEYQFQTEAQDPKSLPNSIWKIKEDTYDVMEVVSIDARGKRFSWKGPYKQNLTVKAGSLAIFGAWYLVYGKGGSVLRLLIKPQANHTPKERLKNVFTSVIDGLSGRVLENYNLKAAVERDFRAVIKTTRKIQMVYKLDLFKDNRFGQDIASVISANDALLRSCYTDLLEVESANQGTLAYTVVYSGEAQSIKGLKVKASNFKNSRFLECLNLKLLGLTFPVKKSMIGELTFQFQASE